MLAVGAPREDSSPVGDQSDNSAENAGAVYVFSRRDGGWEQEAYLKADSLPAISNQEGHLFGQAVSLSGDGSTLAVAASGGIEIQVGQDSFGTFYRTGGGVYIFERVDGSWGTGYFRSRQGEPDNATRTIWFHSKYKCGR